MGFAAEEPGQRAGFDRIWTGFLAAPSLVDGRHDTPRWTCAEGRFALALLRIDAASLQPALADCQAALGTFPGLRLHPDHFLHVTLQELGFVVDDPSRPDELSKVRLEEFAQSAVGPVADRRPYRVRVGGLNSFEDAPFLEVHDDGSTSALHTRLFELSAIPRAAPFAYLPHVTIGHYLGAGRPSDVIAMIEPFRDRVFGELTVEAVEIVTLDPAETYPALRPYAIIPLGG